jgi:hypothetical protein
MTSQQHHIGGVARLLADYRQGEVPTPDSERVSRWLDQFHPAIRPLFISEIHYVLGKTYPNRAMFERFYRNQIKHGKLTGGDPEGYWKRANFLRIQSQGSSQSDVLEIGPDRDSVRVRIMRWCLRAKLMQNFVECLLLTTETKPIVEESRKDDFWGVKPDEFGVLIGQNVLGRPLMELREDVKARPRDHWEALASLHIQNFWLAQPGIRREKGKLQFLLRRAGRRRHPNLS